MKQFYLVFFAKYRYATVMSTEYLSLSDIFEHTHAFRFPFSPIPHQFNPVSTRIHARTLNLQIFMSRSLLPLCWFSMSEWRFLLPEWKKRRRWKKEHTPRANTKKQEKKDELLHHFSFWQIFGWICCWCFVYCLYIYSITPQCTSFGNKRFYICVYGMYENGNWSPTIFIFLLYSICALL